MTRISRLVLTGLAAALAVPALLTAAPAYAAVTELRINEVESSGGTPGDWVELTNPTSQPVDAGGLVLSDSDDSHRYQIPAQTTIQPGAQLVLHEADFGFGLGGADSVRLFSGDNVIDSYSWTTHAPVTYGRCPDGTGEFTENATATPGEPNDCQPAAPSTVVLNEVESNGDPVGDWIELANLDRGNSVDVSGWTIIDDDPTHTPITLPAGTSIESGGYLAIYTDNGGGFGLGGADSVTIRNPAGEVIDSYSWSGHARQSWARCPDGTGEFADSREPTRGGVNACGDAPAVPSAPWPGFEEVTTADAAGVLGDDLSGLDWRADGRSLLAVNNGLGELLELTRSGGGFSTANSWRLRYPDGSGTPDAEGVSEAGDGSVLVATERNNDASGTSRPSVLRYRPTDSAELAATQEWNLASIVGTGLGANSGLEAIEWISDADAVAGGLIDRRTGRAYDPATTPAHFGGIVAVGVEGTGAVHLVVLGEDGSSAELASVASGFPGVMALDWQLDTQLLWVMCDEVCDGRGTTMRLGELTPMVPALPGGDRAETTGAVFARPEEMGNFANEGFAIAPQSQCTTGRLPVLWADDGASAEHALRRGAVPCRAATPTPTPTPTGGPQPTGSASPTATAVPTRQPSAIPPVADQLPQPPTRPLANTGGTPLAGLLAALAAIGTGWFLVRRR